MPNDFLINLGISLVLTAIKLSFKSEHSKQTLKTAFLKIFRAIATLYSDDPDFHT